MTGFRTERRFFPYPPKLAEGLEANRTAYIDAVKGLRIAPVWTMNEVQLEPEWQAFAHACLDKVRTPGAICSPGAGGCEVSWRVAL